MNFFILVDRRKVVIYNVNEDMYRYTHECVSIHKKKEGYATDYFGGMVEVLISKSV